MWSQVCAGGNAASEETDEVASDKVDHAGAAHDLVVLVELLEQLVELGLGELDPRAHLVSSK